MIAVNHCFSQSVLRKIVFMGCGLSNSSQKRSYDQIIERNCNLATYIKLGLSCQHDLVLRPLCIQKMIAVYHLFYQSVLRKHSFDGLTTF